MRVLLTCFLGLGLFSGVGAMAQVPFEKLPPGFREEAREVVTRADFAFQTRTQPKRVKVATMEKLFDHPRLGAAMWRYCQFVPSFCAQVHADGSWSIDDSRGLRGTLRLLLRQPGLRIYLVEGQADAGRLKSLSPAVGARMVTVYRYWDGPNGFESHLQTWTKLDSALLGFFSKPFRGYVRGRQDEFIAYINGNVATFGEFAERDPQEFLGPLQREGDPVAIADFKALFGKK
ncbi:MAG: hypothetical protein LWX11_01630 [Firmicutes bacterium]|nr:hypothetical protein [Bacillota bacterium]